MSTIAPDRAELNTLLTNIPQAAEADLSTTVTNPPTQAEVQAIVTKINNLLAKLRTAGIIA
jgi:hypothetical protein